ncbi:MAG: potassium-transporting ATPase subunit KdpA [Lentimicrobiaceae bacterium]|nr:potassium-transporting ATPase subunit KdpA [Lentimicrobiaceae bacterium]
MNDLVQIAIYIIGLLALAPLLGLFMAKVFMNEKHILKPVFGWLEKGIYRFTGANENQEMNWKTYTWGLVLFNFFGFLVVFLLQLFQNQLPGNPQHLPDVSWHLALNTAVSFMTNTNWQSYGGEITLGYLVQMLGLTVQNFVSAATGIAVLLALLRGLTRKSTETLGNFWTDLTRSVVYVLLPLSLLLAIVLVGQGVVQTFSSYQTAETLQGAKQSIPLGPAASQIAIKQLGTNGGGFFNTNSAHPFENPTPLSNFLEMLAILLIPSALTITYGKLSGSLRHGWTLFLVMFILFSAGLITSFYSEYHYNAALHVAGCMEGKETRLGVTNSVLWSVVTTDASNGSVNAMHDSFSPLAGMVAIFNMMIGEVVFGGVGAGLYGMAVFIILTVFIAGLMVGRTPEYLGKKIEAYEVRMAMIAVLAPNFVVLVFTAWACRFAPGLAGLNNTGPHGFSEILYAYSSAAGNNGSAFAGLNTNTVFYNLTIAIGMIIGRFGIIIPVLAIAGNMARKKITPLSAGTFRTDNWLFVMLLIGVILIVGGLTFFPALSLGPVMEHLLMNSGITF